MAHRWVAVDNNILPLNTLVNSKQTVLKRLETFLEAVRPMFSVPLVVIDS